MGRNKCKRLKGHFSFEVQISHSTSLAAQNNLANAFCLRRICLLFLRLTGRKPPVCSWCIVRGSIQTLLTKAIPPLPSSSASPWRYYLDIEGDRFQAVESSPWDQPEIPSAMQSAVSSPRLVKNTSNHNISEVCVALYSLQALVHTLAHLKSTGNYLHSKNYNKTNKKSPLVLTPEKKLC